MKGPNSVTREASPTTGTAGSTPGTSSPRHDSGLRDGLRSMTYEQGAAALAPVQMHGGGGGGKSGSGGERISGRATDRAIRKHIKVHVQEAKKGTRIAGNFEVCDEATWEEAVKTEFEDDWEAYLPANGFVSFKGPKPKAYLHHARADTGTMVHEAVHIYGGVGVVALAQPLNEGITEYFTRIVLRQIDPDGERTAYRQRFGVAALLVDRTSEAIVAAAYFDGDHAGLQEAFEDNWEAKGGDGFTEDPWTEFLFEMTNESFDIATAYLP